MDEFQAAEAEILKNAKVNGLTDDQINVVLSTLRNLKFTPNINVNEISLSKKEGGLPWNPQGDSALDLVKKAKYASRNLSEGESRLINLYHPLYSTLIRDIFLVMNGKSLLEQSMLLRDFTTHAKRLDEGGVLRHNDAELESHMNFMHQFIIKEIEACDSSKQKFLKPGVDPIAMGSKCLKGLEDLSPCNLSQLRRHTVNYEKVLYVTTVAPAFRVSGVVLLVEDEQRRYVTVTLYNYIDETFNISETQLLFPEGTTLAIKEPYLKCFTTGYLGIRIDHPENIHIIQSTSTYFDNYSNLIFPLKSFTGYPSSATSTSDDPPLPPSSSTSFDVESLKTRGNDYFQQKEWVLADDTYSTALAALPPSSSTLPDPWLSLRVTLLSNRAAARLALCRWGGAFEDCSLALSLDPQHIKAKFRSVEALLHLSRLEKAEAVLADLLAQSETQTGLSSGPSTMGQLAGEAERLLVEISQLKHQRDGLYDPEKLLSYGSSIGSSDPVSSKSAKPVVPSVFLSYIGPVQFAQVGEKRVLGLFTNTDVKANTLLFVERAVAFVEERSGVVTAKKKGKQQQQQQQPVPQGQGLGSGGRRSDDAILQEMLCRKVLENPLTNARLTALLKYGPNSDCTPVDIDANGDSGDLSGFSLEELHEDVAMVNAMFSSEDERTFCCRLHVLSRSRINKIAGECSRSSQEFTTGDKEKSSGGRGRGLWPMLSFLTQITHLQQEAQQQQDGVENRGLEELEGNVCEEYFGDLVFVRANKDLNSGTMINQQYSLAPE